MKKNAEVMAQKFMNKGYHVISGGTHNHLMLIDPRSKGEVTGRDAEDALIKADITIRVFNNHNITVKFCSSV